MCTGGGELRPLKATGISRDRRNKKIVLKSVRRCAHVTFVSGTADGQRDGPERHAEKLAEGGRTIVVYLFSRGRRNNRGYAAVFRAHLGTVSYYAPPVRAGRHGTITVSDDSAIPRPSHVVLNRSIKSL